MVAISGTTNNNNNANRPRVANLGRIQRIQSSTTYFYYFSTACLRRLPVPLSYFLPSTTLSRVLPSPIITMQPNSLPI